MSVHPRSDLCIEYQEFYKNSTSKFRKEIDNKMMKRNINQSDVGVSQYTAYLEQLNKGKQSKDLNEMKKRITTPDLTKPVSEANDSQEESEGQK